MPRFLFVYVLFIALPDLLFAYLVPYHAPWLSNLNLPRALSKQARTSHSLAGISCQVRLTAKIESG